MMVNKYILIAITLIITIFTNYILDLSFLVGGITTVLIVTLGYIIYINYGQRKRYGILESDLDPEGFIQASHKTYKYRGKNKQINSLYNLDLAFGYLSLGKYEKALEFLEEVEEDHLPRANKSILSYYNTLMLAYYNLEEYDKAEEIYNRAKEYKVKDKLAEQLMDLLMANKYLYEGDYERSRERFEKYPKDKISKRLELEILFDLAIIDEKQGNIEGAKSKYGRIAREGNKLYSAKLSHEKLR